MNEYLLVIDLIEKWIVHRFENKFCFKQISTQGSVTKLRFKALEKSKTFNSETWEMLMIYEEDADSMF